MPRTSPSRFVKLPARPGAWAILVTLLLGVCVVAQSSVAQTGSVIFVTTTVDKISSTGGCSLQEAIYSANLENNIAVDSINSDGSDHFITTGCVAGSGNDTIVLPTNAVFPLSSIVAADSHNPFGPTATPIIFSNITIEANGAVLELAAGSPNMRAFAVGTASVNTNPAGAANVISGTGNLTIKNAYIKGFTVKGGNGKGGGGGGMGAGGAIYIQGGGLTVVNSTFEGNGAVGGNGSPIDSGAGGGGGGLSGNGGQPGSIVEDGYVNGGGGGGSRGNGGQGAYDMGGFAYRGGGGGGGTVTDGFSPDIDFLTDGGFNCGGNGGTGFGDRGEDNDGHAGFCPGGGGGGGVANGLVVILSVSGNGGNGNYGGGGGGGGYFDGNGGNGGFGGGGGSSSFFPGTTSGNGGDGGFGGGGGGGQGGITGGPGRGGVITLTINGVVVTFPGFYGGGGDHPFGGGGGALGGAIFNHGGTVNIQNSTFNGNFVTRGLGSGGTSDNGEDAGGAIFSLDGSLTIVDSTISGNQSTGTDGGLSVLSLGISPAVSGPAFVLHNTIIAGNGPNECRFSALGSVTPTGTGNLVQSNAGCPGVVATGDPLLGPLQLNGGNTPTMAIGESSPAWNVADAGTSLATDQRGQARPALGGFDIGAFELCQDHFGIQCVILAGIEQAEPLTIASSPVTGGSTTPSSGTADEPLDSVVTLNATPNPGFGFQDWTGNVTDPSSASTTVVMDNGQTVTANFVACMCATDVSGSIAVARGGFVLNIGTGRLAQSVILTNNSTMTLAGPFSLVLDGLSSDATLFNPSGTTSALFPPAGSPYVNATATLAPGQKVTIALQFTDPTKGALTYATRVLAGPGSR